MAVVLESDCRKATDGGTQRLINFESSNDVPMDRFRSAAPEAFLSVISMRRAADGFPLTERMFPGAAITRLTGGDIAGYIGQFPTSCRSVRPGTSAHCLAIQALASASILNQ
jgi:hypothetical protein